VGAPSLASRVAAVLEGVAAFSYGLVDAQGERTVARDELAAAAWGFAVGCRDAGARPGDVVAIAWRHGVAPIAAWAGAVLGGFVPSFVPSDDPDLQQRLGTAVRLTVGPATAAWAGAAPGEVTAAPGIAIVQRTSGTTGVHRTILLSHARVLAQADALAAAIDLDVASDRIASCLPLHHDMGLVSTVLLPLLHGVPCVHVDPDLWRADASAWVRVLGHSGATLTWLPPAALGRMTRVSADGADLSRLRQVVCGGEVVTDGVLREFSAHFGSAGLVPEAVATGWGMAENVAAVTHSPRGRAPSRLRVRAASFAPGRAIEIVGDEEDDALVLVTAGTAIDGTEVVVRGIDGRECGDGVLGELFIRGTCQPDPGTWSATGDVGLTRGGEVFVCGRLAELLHVDGRWILPHEAEQAAARVAGVRAGRVAAIRDGGGFVVLYESEHAVDATRVADAVERSVHRRPRAVAVATESLPRNTAGKSCRSRCATP